MIEILTSWGFILGLILMAIVTFVVDSAYRSQLMHKNDEIRAMRNNMIILQRHLDGEINRSCMLEREIDEAGMVLCEGEKRTFLRKKRMGKDLTKTNKK